MVMLPIESAIPDLRRILAEGRHVLLTAPPGAGKTTAVPLALFNEPWLRTQRIIMLEPRRLAARAAAHRMASTLGEAVGETVGYRIRFDTKIGDKTRIEVVTEGILTRLLQHDPSLTGYGLVVFDEFHERSLHADLGLALTLDSQRALRDDLRILIMSATLDCVAVADLLGGAPVISSEGRLFPVETHYTDLPLSEPIDQAIVSMIKKTLVLESGSMLVFLPGMAEIRRVERRLLKSGLAPHIRIAPFHGDLPQQEQERAIAAPAPGTRKIVLATAIAETSLTIEGIRLVIDSGLMRVPRFDPRTSLTRLDTIAITQDSAEQRRGRAGRVEPGACYRLWTAAEQKTLLPRRPPEMLDADLAPLMLELAAWGTVDPRSLSWLTPPPSGAVTQANDLLTRLGALDGHGRITEHGRRMAECPLHPRLAHMVLKAVPLGLDRLACDVAALLGERDILRGPSGWRNADLRLRLDVLHGSVLQESGLTVDRGAVQRVSRVARQIMTYVNRSLSHPPSQHVSRAVGRSLDRLGLLLAYAYPDRIAQRQAGDDRRYRLANGRGAVFAHPEPLASEPYLVMVDLEGGHEWARIFLAAPVASADVEVHLVDRLHDVECVAWDDRAQTVRARKQRRLGALVLKDQPLVKPRPEQVSAALIHGLRQTGLSALPWTKELRQWTARVEFLRRLDDQGHAWPDVSDQALLDRLEEWLMPYVIGLTHLDQVQRMNLVEPVQAMLTREQRKQLDWLAPTHVSVPTGSRIQVNYQDPDRPALAVRLQEMFGCQDTPTVAAGAVPLVLHLLSPAGRPVQVTRDLGHFWRSSYHEVRKALRGRYPKHPWPDDPWRAQPIRRTKAKR